MITSFLSPSHLPLFFFNDTATTEIYTLSLHDALPISVRPGARPSRSRRPARRRSSAGPPGCAPAGQKIDRKSTRLNSSHVEISYAVFCLKKKKKKKKIYNTARIVRNYQTSLLTRRAYC